MSLALLEATALFAAVCGSIFAWGHPLLSDRRDGAAMLGQAAALSLRCIVAGVALILAAGFSGLFPDTRIAEGPFLSSVLVMVGLLPPFRAVGHGIMRRRPFADRVLVVGTGPLARKLVGEIRGA